MRLLYWDEQSAGHHHRYAAAFGAARPQGFSVDWPPWFQDKGTPIPTDANHAFNRVVRATAEGSYDAVVLGEGTALLRAIAASRQALPPVLSLELRSPQAWLHPANRGAASPRELAAGLGQLAAMEVLARRSQRARTLHLNPAGAMVGSKAVKRNAGTYQDPLEVLPPRSPRPEPGRILLPGVQAPRKGLPLLASAVRRLPSASHRPHVVVAGPVAPGYETPVEEVTASLSAAGVRVTLRTGWLSRDDLADEFARATVIAFPYIRHIGGSGFVGTATQCSQAAIVCPDLGLLGEMARSMGLCTFRHADLRSLSEALGAALEGPPAHVPNDLLTRFYATEEAFGRHLWAECQRLVDGS